MDPCNLHEPLASPRALLSEWKAMMEEGYLTNEAYLTMTAELARVQAANISGSGHDSSFSLSPAATAVPTTPTSGGALAERGMEGSMGTAAPSPVLTSTPVITSAPSPPLRAAPTAGGSRYEEEKQEAEAGEGGEDEGAWPLHWGDDGASSFADCAEAQAAIDAGMLGPGTEVWLEGAHIMAC
jgi:hypothetical protein